MAAALSTPIAELHVAAITDLRMLSSLLHCWLGPCNALLLLPCSAIWLFGNSGANLLPVPLPLLLHLLLTSCLTGCCKIPVARALPLAHGNLCLGCLVWQAFRHCSKPLALQYLERSCTRLIPSPGAKRYPFRSALSAGWNVGSCRLIHSSLADKYAAGCLLCAIWGSLWRMPFGWPHLLFRYSWSRAAWWVYLPEPRRQKRACTAALCCLASRGLRLHAGACASGRLFLRFCTNRVVQTLAESWTSCRRKSKIRPGCARRPC